MFADDEQEENMTTENVAELQPAPVMRPTIVRRVVPGGVEVLERQMEDAERALCVFWSVEDAERAMLEAGCPRRRAGRP
jgi:hypothetical protein